MLIGRDPDRLIWEYLDGEITPPRAQLLSKVLSNKASVRERFVEAAVLHGMLLDYLKKEQPDTPAE